MSACCNASRSAISAPSILFLNLDWRGLVAATVLLLGGYWALMTFVPVPGIGAGSYAPNANLANWIDTQFLPGGMWDKTRDPEGLLSTLPAIATCLHRRAGRAGAEGRACDSRRRNRLADRRRHRPDRGRLSLVAAVPASSSRSGPRLSCWRPAA